jgi:hypothetical protein
MTLRFIIAVALASSVLVLPNSASALTMDQVAAICASHEGECSEHPILQAYVGGALDLIAMLDEETDYLGEIYCKEPSALFDVPAIIQYMGKHRVEYADRNAMLLVIRYLEEKGGC